MIYIMYCFDSVVFTISLVTKFDDKQECLNVIFYFQTPCQIRDSI